MKYKVRYIKMLILERMFRRTIRRLEADMLWNLNERGTADKEGEAFRAGMNFATVMILDRCVNKDERGVWSFCDA